MSGLAHRSETDRAARDELLPRCSSGKVSSNQKNVNRMDSEKAAATKAGGAVIVICQGQGHKGDDWPDDEAPGKGGPDQSGDPGLRFFSICHCR